VEVSGDFQGYCRFYPGTVAVKIRFCRFRPDLATDTDRGEPRDLVALKAFELMTS
jgi:hypothetical protein